MALGQINSSKMMWVIVGSLVAIVSFALLFMWMNAQPEPAPVEPTKTVAAVKPKEAAPVAVAEPAKTEMNDILIDQKALVKDTILQDEVPQNSTLAKEEIAKLDDIQKQLNAQQDILEAQQVDADQLIQLKEEQIKLLEEQLSARN